MSYLGIDVGSSYIKLWHEDNAGTLLCSRCLHHKGSPATVLRDELERLNPSPGSLCVSGLRLGDGLDAWQRDGLLSEIEYLKDRHHHRKLLVLGAEKIELVHYDDDGSILSYQRNPACAAGTGSFLDEQMLRLGMDFSCLEHIPIMDDAPLVATRCAVFAKTDLIHLQQEGHSAHAMYNGLCRGLVLSSLKSVFGGSLPDGDGMLATGGLLVNAHIRHFLERAFPNVTIAETPAFTRARGLCLRARRASSDGRAFIAMFGGYKDRPVISEAHKPLELTRSVFPEAEMIRRTDVYGNEVWHDLERGEHVEGFLGIDIGSTSTKAVLTDERGGIRLDIYTRTAGNPIQATRRIFRGVRSVTESAACRVTIRGCGTTGSGRKLVGLVVGADLIVNEISAHAKGALTLDRNVETIFEIGGQDAKFIRLKNGRVVDVNMNYVCAAGTGSFVEEQARTLGMSLDDIGAKVMGVAPLPNSDRCTVFMNQEITRQIASGLPPDRIMAGVLVAVFRNYIGKVVGNRPYSRDRIVFQGATARNRALVAALEQLTGAQVKVSPFCHVMGAYGAALLTRDKLTGKTSFKGLDIPDVSVSESTCRGCENTCRITHVSREGEKTSWGHLCGREPGERTRGGKQNRCVVLRNSVLEGFAPRPAGDAVVVKMPALGLNEEFMPLLAEVMHECGYRLELCRPGREDTLRELSSLGPGDFCYPIKVAMASAHVILKQDPACRVLLPFIIQDERDPSIAPRSLYCPFISALPGFFGEITRPERIVTPLIDLSAPASELVRLIRGSLLDAGLQPVSPGRLRRGLRRGMEALRRYRAELAVRARGIFEEIDDDRDTIVLLGRPYNLYHRILNLGIPELIESLGHRVITMDAVPDDTTNREVCELFPDMYWNQGLKILRKAMSIRKRANLFPLMISNFSCGPDSFILTYLEEICRDKPYLILELDEHGSATGYQTRIEAFLDMIEQYRPDSTVHHRIANPGRTCYDIRRIPENTTIWIPQIHPYIPRLWASVLNRCGLDARPTGEETGAECAAGRALCRGSECLPAAVTTGKFISIVENAPEGMPQALFMPRAGGPCRFGQYATLQSLIMENAGLENTLIFSPTSENGYAFLSRETELEVWKALCLGDALYKLRCRIVPYHEHPLKAEADIDGALDEICRRISAGRDWKGIVRDLTSSLDWSGCRRKPPKPLVGIVGEIFVRLNSFSNQHIVQAIETHGGEAWLAPMAEWIYYVLKMLAVKSPFLESVKTRIRSRYLHHVEQSIMHLFSPVLDDRHEPSVDNVLAQGSDFLPQAFEGEAILTLGRARLFADQGARLVVNCSPFGCMPGRITSYLFQTARHRFRVPVVSLYYDGTGDVADQVGIYLRSITGADERAPSVHTAFTRPKGAEQVLRRGLQRKASSKAS